MKIENQVDNENWTVNWAPMEAGGTVSAELCNTPVSACEVRRLEAPKGQGDTDDFSGLHFFLRVPPEAGPGARMETQVVHMRWDPKKHRLA